MPILYSVKSVTLMKLYHTNNIFYITLAVNYVHLTAVISYIGVHHAILYKIVYNSHQQIFLIIFFPLLS